MFAIDGVSDAIDPTTVRHDAAIDLTDCAADVKEFCIDATGLLFPLTASRAMPNRFQRPSGANRRGGSRRSSWCFFV
ncbi:hypothetical protein [Bradyrhizobium algeriense]|uniref:hypothetical protein n=1 Tax=Bradyrhizobium algeriense TaxID=634784 RepID=UPI0011AE73A8|nr:hypothetical protein [Bradyrhizobium algeriense]